MPSPQDAFRVLAITTSDALFTSVKSALGKDENYLFIDRRLKPNDLMEALESLQPHCLVLDFVNSPTKPLELVDSLAWQFPQMAIVAALPKEQIPEANKVILAGARAFIAQPLVDQELLETIGRIREMHLRSQGMKPGEGAGEVAAANRGTFVVFSPKGGVGSSLVAVNLAMALKESGPQEVLLMDGKLLFGDLDLMLNLKTDNTIADFVPHIGSLDESLIRDVVAEHVSGIKVLPAPPNPVAAQGIHPEVLHRIVGGLQSVYPVLVIDAGNFLNDNSVTLMDASNKVLLIMKPDMASLRAASRFFELCRTTLSFSKDRILVVVNQYDQHEGLSLGDIERALEIKVFATVPWDARAAVQSINRGVPVSMPNQKNQLRKAFQAMAKEIAALVAGKAAPPTKGKKMPQVLVESSRRG